MNTLAGGEDAGCPCAGAGQQAGPTERPSCR
jgi:hypothetical protein